MRPIDANSSEGMVKLHSAIHGDGAYEAFKRISSEFYENHTYKFVALTLDGEPRPDIITFTAEFWRTPDGAEAPPPNDPLTLEGLQEMDGEPVYDWMGGEWYIICEVTDDEVIMTDGTVFDIDEESPNNADGRFYRHKPEGN